MTPVRRWGPGPYRIAVIHGGPGAPGEVAPVAREISTVRGALEPFQTATTLDGQVEELRAVLLEHGTPPVTLIGFSYGAFLSWIVAARYPELVSRLILIGCPPFEDSYAASITKLRLTRLTQKDKAEAQALMDKLGSTTGGEANTLLARLGTMLARADAFAPVPNAEEGFTCQYEVFRDVWDEVCELRRNRILLQMAKSIACPVVAIHGDWDPHPAVGVSEPLRREIPGFRLVLLEKCGHRPWIERNAAAKFFEVLVNEI